MSAQLVADVFDQLPVGVVLIDRDSRLREFNSRFAEYVRRFANSPSRWLTRGERIDHIAPFLHELTARILSGEPEVSIQGARLIARDTPTFWDVTARPLGDPSNASLLILVTVVDANERVRARGLAEDREAQFRQIFETTPDAIIIADPITGQIIDANDAACAMHGYTHTELVGMDARRLLHPDSHALVETYFGTVIAGGVFRTRSLNLKKSGAVFSADVSGSALHQDGRLRIVAIVRDISDQVSAEEALRDTHSRLADAARERTDELAMLVDVSRELGATRDVETLMRLVLERAGRIIRFAGGAVLLLEDDRRLRVASVAGDVGGPHPGQVWPLESLPHCARVVESHQPMLENDARDLAPPGTPGETGRVFSGLSAARSWMGIPLLAQERVVGVMAFVHQSPGAFRAEQAKLMLALGNQLAAAIENARLFAEADARTRELATLVEVSRDLASALRPDELLSRTLDRLQRVLNCTGSSLLLMDEEDVTLVAASGLSIQLLPDNLVPGDLRFSRQALLPISNHLESAGAVVIDDVLGEGELAESFRSAAGSYLGTILSPIRSWMAVPLFRQDHLAGVLAASSTTPGFFTPEHVSLAAGFASHVSVALETSRLFGEVERRAREMESLSRVASVLQLDEPVHRVLDRLAARIAEATAAVATVVTLLDGGRHVTNTGSAGHADGFVDAMAEAARKGAIPPSAAAARGRRLIVKPNGRSELLANPHFRPVHPFLASAPWEGIAIAPMIYRGQALGTVSAYFPPGAFASEEDLTLLQALADQAAIAMENIQLFEATERRLRGAQALARVASTLTFEQSVTETLRTLADAVVEGSRAVACLLLLADDNEEVHVAGSSGLPDGYGEAVIRLYMDGTLPPEPLLALELQETQVLHNVREQCLADPAQAPIHPFLEEVEWDTVVITPVTFHGRSIGTLNAYYLATSVQDEPERAFLATMADQAALALENARLYAETQQHIREIDALYHADEQLHQSLLLDEVLQALVDVVVDNLHADKSLVVAFDRAGGPWRVRASRGYSAELIAIADEALRTLPPDSEKSHHSTRVVEDAANDRRTLRALTEPAGIHAYIDVPIVVGGEIFGIFSVNFDAPRRFSQADVRLYTALAQRAAMAIENARLFARAQHAASLEERQRLARELHDSVSQALYGIALGTRTARTLLERDVARVPEPLDYVMSLAEGGLAELRALIFELRPESLELEGLIAAFNKQAAALSARHGITVEIGFDTEPEVSLNVKEALYRIGQEAMHNTVKHAHAKKIDVRLLEYDGCLTLEVRDDGQGFNPSREFPGHLGITSMRERARALGGELFIESAPGAGTAVRLTLPLR